MLLDMSNNIHYEFLKCSQFLARFAPQEWPAPYSMIRHRLYGQLIGSCVVLSVGLSRASGLERLIQSRRVLEPRLFHGFRLK